MSKILVKKRRDVKVGECYRFVNNGSFKRSGVTVLREATVLCDDRDHRETARALYRRGIHNTWWQSSYDYVNRFPTALLSTGKLKGMQRAVATAVYQHGPGTSAEILQLSGGLDRNRNLARARFTELRDAGILREDGARRCNVTGRTAIVWVFDPGAPTKKKATARETIAKLHERLAFFETIARTIVDEYDDVKSISESNVDVLRRKLAP